MSDKKIEIKIAATGGDQAAAEVKKVDAAVKAEVVTIKEADTAMKAETATVKTLDAALEQHATTVKRADTAQTAMAASGNKVSGSLNFRSQLQNVGYQVQDFAVQVGSGTSAIRAFSQQAPQLLSGFGPIGVTLGTVAAIAGPLAGALFAAGNAAEESGGKAAEASEKFAKLVKIRADRSAAEALKDNKSFIDALDDTTQAFKRQNDEVQRSINLIQAKHRAEVEIQSAQAALDLANIDASDAPEAVKIQRRAHVNERLERQRFENRKTEAGYRVNAANNTARGATTKAEIEADKLETTKSELAIQQSEAAELRGKYVESIASAAKIKVLDELFKKADAELYAAENSGIDGGPSPYSPERLDEFKRARDVAAVARDAAANESKGFSKADEIRLNTLQGEDGKSGKIGDLKKSIDTLAKAAEDLEQVAIKARADAEGIRAVETANLSGDFEATKLKIQTGRVSSFTAAQKAEETARKQKEDEENRLKNEADRDASLRQSAINTSSGSLTQGGFAAAESAGKLGAPARGVADLQKAVANLSRDPGNEGNLATMEKLLEQLIAWAESNKKGNGPDAAKLRDLERRVETLIKQNKLK